MLDWLAAWSVSSHDRQCHGACSGVPTVVSHSCLPKCKNAGVTDVALLPLSMLDEMLLNLALGRNLEGSELRALREGEYRDLYGGLR